VSSSPAAAAVASLDLRRSISMSKGQAPLKNAAASAVSPSPQSAMLDEGAGTTQALSSQADLGSAAAAAPSDTLSRAASSTSAAAASATTKTAALADAGSDGTPAAKTSPRSTPTRNAAASPARTAAAGLPFGTYRLVRLKKAVPCDACTGTTEQETHDGLKEVFQCDVTLQPGMHHTGPAFN
jgi:hypothetical protein